MSEDDLRERISELETKTAYYTVGSTVGYTHNLRKKFRRLMKDPLMLPALLEWDVNWATTDSIYAAIIEAQRLRREFRGQ